jgi:23S rRNA pseudouridine2605 synthase
LATPPDKPIKKTLERVLSKAGVGSRTDARSWIHSRRVKVNGRIVENPDHWVDLDSDRVLFDDKPLASASKRYILLHKPTGYITSYKDPQNRPTVYDLIGDVATWVSPVGRLDLDTSGLLILTNDNAFAEGMTNPDFHVSKTYLVKAATRLSDQDLMRLASGVALSDGPTRPAAVKRVRDSGNSTYLELTITEGRNRQVRRMIEAVDSKVLKLVRIGIGRVTINGLAVGAWRDLSPKEL